MKFHKEGNKIITTTLVSLAVINLISFYFFGSIALIASLIASLIILTLVMQFFRVPKRVVTMAEDLVICPADGKVVVIEETEETEYLKDRRIQVSIFMSPLNVHINWFPIGGMVSYFKYHAGKYLVAWHPKSSTENERTTVAVKHANGTEILFRQIAGAVARRIVCYAKKDSPVDQSTEFGFIKFGSRVDVFLPLDAEIRVNLEEMVTGSVTVLAALPKANS
ncbi:phosphatidylserine decarboxylase family protein [Cryomorphaceae bacterium 1068]|nr:phosphatidylserine decarboxylase family protein [Cryomorphaceae bacterium 1068]